MAILVTKYIKKSSSSMGENYRWMANSNINFRISSKIKQSENSKRKVINQRAAQILDNQIKLPKLLMSTSTLT